jgi:hypothetical protein
MESGFLYYFKSPNEMATPGLNPKVVSSHLQHSLPVTRMCCALHCFACCTCLLSGLLLAVVVGAPAGCNTGCQQPWVGHQPCMKSWLAG